MSQLWSWVSGSGLCQEGILSGRVFVRKRALSGRIVEEGFLSARNFVRKDFCQEAGSARKCAARKGESALELGVKLLLSVFVLGGAGGQSASGL